MRTASKLRSEVSQVSIQIRECEFGGLERWNGMVEWNTGLDYWSATRTPTTILHNLLSNGQIITVSSMVTSHACKLKQ